MIRSESQNKAFKDSLLDVASGLSQENIQSVYFLHKYKIKKQCTCSSQSGAECITCPHHYGLTGVTIMDQLLERGVFTENNTESLLEMLDRIGRVDLANTFKETYVSKYPTTDTVPSSPGLDICNGSPRVQPSPFHPLPPDTRPTQLINLRHLPHVQADLETDFTSASPRTPSRTPYMTPTHSPNLCHTPTHLTCDPATCSQKTECLRSSNRYTTAREDTELYMRDSSISPCEECHACGKPSRSNSYPVEANSMVLSLIHSLPANASARLRNQTDRFSQSECVCQHQKAGVEQLDGSDDSSPVDISSTPSPGDSLSQEYTVVLSGIELKEVNQLIQNSSISRTISQKFEDPKPAAKPKLTDSYELIEVDECQPMQCDSCLNNHLPPRAFSLDNLKPKLKKPKFPHQSSAPEVSSSWSNIAAGRSTCRCDGVKGQCTCHEACNHSPVASTPSKRMDSIRRWFGSKDSGMDSSESLKEPGETKKASSLSPQDKDGVGFLEWRISRRKFYDSIYNHKNNYLDKKVRICIGKCLSKQSVNLLLKLYPNGLDKDRGSSVTLTVEVTGVSNSKATYSLDCTFRGIDTQNDTLIASRRHEFLLSEKQLTISDFLSHDIIKQSTAKQFKFACKFQLKVLVDREWVVVDDTNVARTV